MSKLEITKEENFTGEWFLPANDSKPIRRISGTLKWTTKRAKLDLHDCFTQVIGNFYGDESNSYPAIHGRTIENDLITMLDASGHLGSINFGHGQIRQTEKIRSSIMVVGGHVLPSTTYSEMSVRIPGLEYWINRGGVEVTFAHQTNGKPDAYIYKVENLPAEECPVPAIDAMVFFSVRRLLSNLIGHNINMKTYGAVRIVPSEPKTLNWHIDQLNKLCTMLGFVAGTPMGPDQIQVKPAGSGESLDVLAGLRQDKMCELDSANDFFCLRTALGNQLGNAVAKWFSLYESIEVPSQLAFEVLASENLWLHVEYLTLMHALEGLHRATSDGFYMPAEKYEAIRETIIAAIPADVSKSHRASLKSRIEYGNEISLSKRLNDLANRLPDELRRRLFGLDGKIPRSWVDTRNYCTHWDESSHANALEGIYMYNASTRLRLMLRVLYLDLIGIPTETIKKALDGHNRESQRLIHLNNSELRKAHPDAKVQPLMSITLSPSQSVEVAGSEQDRAHD